MPESMLQVPLHWVAHSRAGDKGNRLNISLICYDPRALPYLQDQLSESAVLAHFADRSPSAVRRYTLPQLGAMNFVIDAVLEGGVNRSLSLDRHGKTLSFHLLELLVKVPSSVIHPNHAAAPFES